MRVYAIGDIHGQLDMLRAAHSRIAADRDLCGDRNAPVVHMGDLVDRGPDSRGVIDFLLDGAARGEPWVTLLGNHDRLFRGYLTDGRLTDNCLRADLGWLDAPLGGRQTLASYGIDPATPFDAARSRVPADHVGYLGALVTHFETEDLFFAHAGIRPGVALDQQTEDDLVWIRHEFLNDESDHGKLIVHGHTPVERPEHHGNRVALDTGAGYGAPLTAAVFEGRKCWILTASGRQKLSPPVQSR